MDGGGPAKRTDVAFRMTPAGRPPDPVGNGYRRRGSKDRLPSLPLRFPRRRGRSYLWDKGSRVMLGQMYERPHQLERIWRERSVGGFGEREQPCTPRKAEQNQAHFALQRATSGGSAQK